MYIYIMNKKSNQSSHKKIESRSEHKKLEPPKCGGKEPLISKYQGEKGETGDQGYVGLRGPTGYTGERGYAQGILDYAEFYAMMPDNNPDLVDPGEAVDFPNDGPSAPYTGITRLLSPLAASSFNLTAVGVYQVLFQVDIAEAGQLQLSLNNTPVVNSVVGRATGFSQIVGISFIETTTINSTLSVINPAENAISLTIAPSDGGNNPIVAQLVITRLL
jgi:hypothetical protein